MSTHTYTNPLFNSSQLLANPTHIYPYQKTSPSIQACLSQTLYIHILLHQPYTHTSFNSSLLLINHTHTHSFTDPTPPSAISCLSQLPHHTPNPLSSALHTHLPLLQVQPGSQQFYTHISKASPILQTLPSFSSSMSHTNPIQPSFSSNLTHRHTHHLQQ